MNRGVVSLGLLALLVACGRPATDQGVTELETVDVGETLDAELSTELDEQARQVVAAVSGVLPTDIPVDVPVYSPSSLVDFGQVDGARNYIAVDTSTDPTRVRAEVVSQLAARGWEPVSESGSRLEFGKAGESLTVVIEDLAPGTRLRYEYTPHR